MIVDGNDIPLLVVKYPHTINEFKTMLLLFGVMKNMIDSDIELLDIDGKEIESVEIVVLDKSEKIPTSRREVDLDLSFKNLK